MQKNKNIKLVLGLLLVASSFFYVGNSEAIEYGMLGGKPANPDSKIENSESWFIYSLAAGEFKEDALEVMNLFDNSLDVLIYAADTIKSSGGGFALKQFSEKNEGVGSWVKFYPDEVPQDLGGVFEKKQKSIKTFCALNEEDLKNEFEQKDLNEDLKKSFDQWCAGKDSVEIKIEGKGKKNIPFIISIPQGVDVGEHTGGILIQKKTTDDVAQDGGSSVKLTTRVGIRIYQTVPGEVIKKITMDEFKVVKKFSEFDFSDWFGKEKKPKEFLLETKISNSGNVSIEHSNDIYIKDLLFGKKNEDVVRSFQVLRGDKFLANYSWKKPFFGYYSFQAEIKYNSGSSEEVLKSEVIKKWIIPWREISIALIFIGLIAFILYLIKRRNSKLYGGIGWVEYIVKNGDSVAVLADKYDVKWKVLVKTNKLKIPYHLYEGQAILVPSVEKREKENQSNITGENLVMDNGQIKNEKSGEDVMGIETKKEIVGIVPKVSIKDKISTPFSMAEIRINSDNNSEQIVSEIEKNVDNVEKKCLGKKGKKILIILAITVFLITILVIVGMVAFWLGKKKNTEDKDSIATIMQSENKTPTGTNIPNTTTERKELRDNDVVDKEKEHARETLKIVVLNGGDIPGSAGKTKEILLKEGFLEVISANAQKDDYIGKIIYFKEGFAKDAEILKEIIKKNNIDSEIKAGFPAEEAQDQADILVLLGK